MIVNGRWKRENEWQPGQGGKKEYVHGRRDVLINAKHLKKGKMRQEGRD